MSRRNNIVALKIAGFNDDILEVAAWLVSNCTKPCWIDSCRPQDWASEHPSKPTIVPKTIIVDVSFRSDDDHLLFQFRWHDLIKEYEMIAEYDSWGYKSW